jgi:hypothetical protein
MGPDILYTFENVIVASVAAIENAEFNALYNLAETAFAQMFVVTE